MLHTVSRRLVEARMLHVPLLSHPKQNKLSKFKNTKINTKINTEKFLSHNPLIMIPLLSHPKEKH